MIKPKKSPSSSSADGPLLGMIVDRSSFDTDDDLTVLSKEERRPQSAAGKVRRRLRWKPVAFRINQNQMNKRQTGSDLSSVTSAHSRQSIHTFHSTETRVRSNQASKRKLPISRPNYNDTFAGMPTVRSGISPARAGMSTIHNEASYQFVQANLHNKRGSFDMDTIRDSDFPSPRPPTVPRHKASPRKRTMPKRFIKKQQPNQTIASTGDLPPSQPSSSSLSRTRTQSSPVDSPASPELTRSSPEDTRFPEDDALPQASAPLRHGADDATLVGPESAIQSEPNVTPTRSASTSAVVTPTGSAAPPTSPRAASASGLVSPWKVPSKRYNHQSPETPVPAKVSIDLSSSPSNLSFIMKHSGILIESPRPLLPKRMHKQPVDKIARASPLPSPSSSKRHSPVNSASHWSETQCTGSSRLSIGASSKLSEFSKDTMTTTIDDDSCTLSSRSQMSNDGSVAECSTDRAEPGRVVHHGSRIVPTSSAASASPSIVPKSSNRRSRGAPADVDNGAFVGADRNLQAIHEMAAEHMAHGEYEEALEVFQEIHRGQKARYGDSHFRTGTALHNLAIAYLKCGKREEAIEACKQAVKIRQQTLAPNHPDVAVSLAQLGVSSLESQQYGEALAAFRGALYIRRETLGPKHPKVGKILNNIGCALFELQELHGATLAFEEALEIQRETLRQAPTLLKEEDDGPKSTYQIMLSIASTLCNIGSIKLRKEQYEDAGVAMEEALLIQQSVLGDEHPIVLNTVKSIEHIEKASEKSILDRAVSADFFLWSMEQKENLHPRKGRFLDFAVHNPNMERITLMVRSWRWGGSQRWYQKVGEFLPETACGQVYAEDDGDGDDDDDALSSTGSTWSFRKTRAGGCEV